MEFILAFKVIQGFDSRSFTLAVGKPVPALIKEKWLLGVVTVVFPEPNFYIVPLSDGCLFRR
jgi:hypothetical protein